MNKNGCRSRCGSNKTVDNLYVCGNIYAEKSTLYISTITTGKLEPVKISSISTCNIVPCNPGVPITVTGNVIILGDLTVSGNTNILNYNLTNVNAQNTGISILGPLTGPGGNVRSFRTLTSSGGTLTITSTSTGVNFETVNNGTVTGASNEGSGVSIFDPVNSTSTTLVFKTLTSTNGSIMISPTATTINLTTLNTGTVTSGNNEGPGVHLFDQINSTPAVLQFRTLTSTGGTVTITNTATTVNIESNNTGTVTGGTTEGGGTTIFDIINSTPTTLVFKSLTSTDGSIVITSTATTVNLSALNKGTVTSGNNEGPGVHLFDQINSTPTTLQFRTLTSIGGTVAITNTATTVNLESVNSGTVTGGVNEGTGAPILDVINSTATTLVFKSLTSNNGSIVITSTATTINLSALNNGTVTHGANEGGGVGIFDPGNSTASTLEFKTLTSTGGTVTITNTATTVNLESLGTGGTVTAGNNEGPGVHLFDQINSTPTTLQFRTLTSVGGTVTITNTATTVDLETTVSTGNNVGAGPGLVYRDNTGAILNFRTISSPDGSVLVNTVGDQVQLEVTPASLDTESINVNDVPNQVIPPNTWTLVQWMTPIIVGTDYSFVPPYYVNSVTAANLVSTRIKYDNDPAIGANNVMIRIMQGTPGGQRSALVQPIFSAGTAPGYQSNVDLFTRIEQPLVNCSVEFFHDGLISMTICNAGGTGGAGVGVSDGNFRISKF